jgi:hypothetical protein
MTSSNASKAAAKVQFVLTGFTQDMGFRVFAFKSAAVDRQPTEYTVRADMALARRHGIPIQDLSILCRGLLERQGDLLQACAITFGDEEMGLHARRLADARIALMAKRKPVNRRPPFRTTPASQFQIGSNQIALAATAGPREYPDEQKDIAQKASEIIG